MTMTLVQTTTVGSGGASSIEFTNIPQTGKDLLLLLSGRAAESGTQFPIFVTLNNSSSAIYSERLLYGTGSSRLTNSATNNSQFRYFYMQGTSTTASTFSNSAMYIINYADSNNKVLSSESIIENNATSSWQSLAAHRWASTAAITSLKLTPDAGTFAQHSSASLYIIS